MKKRMITILCALLSAVFALGMLSGCGLISTDNRRDMEQVVAEVNIAGDPEALSGALASLGVSELSLTAEQLNAALSTEEIYKRDLVAYFMSYGYSYISSGQSYADTFAMLMDALVDRKIVAQFAAVYYLNAGEIVVDRDSLGKDDAGYTEVADTDGLRMSKDITVEGFLAAIEGKEGDAASVAGYEYFLTQKEIDYANYNVMVSINQAIDSYEEDIIARAEDEETSSDEDRATPTGADTLPSYYYPSKDGKIDYGIYTGSNKLSDCGTYEKVDGSTSVTRVRAYARFISALRSNYLVDEDDDISDIFALDYYATEYKTQLEQMMISKFAATLANARSSQLTAGLIEAEYDELLAAQQVSASSGFTTTMDGMSDTSFVVYAPEGRTYGYVYNILIPFSGTQTAELNEAKSRYGEDTAAYYVARNGYLKNVKASDQRESWFNGATDHSFNAAAEGVTDYYKEPIGDMKKSSYLFFKDSYVTSDEGIDRYAGQYPFNGTVTAKDDGSYDLDAHEFGIEEFIGEMNAYINHVTGAKSSSDAGYASGGYYSGSWFGQDAFLDRLWTGTTSEAFYGSGNTFQKKDGSIDYSSAILYKGTVSGVEGVSAAAFLQEESVSYKALSAVNDLMFAYNTDTAGLNSYLGYSIASKEEATSYVSEFEFAAQLALQGGAGTYMVVGTEYGWHVIYVTFTFGDGGETYADGFDYDDRNEEGTFSYYFYQSLKSTVVQNYTSDKQNDILTALNTEANATVYEKRYKDLSNLDVA